MISGARRPGSCREGFPTPQSGPLQGGPLSWPRLISSVNLVPIRLTGLREVSPLGLGCTASKGPGLRTQSSEERRHQLCHQRPGIRPLLCCSLAGPHRTKAPHRLSEPQCSHLASGAQAQAGINRGWFTEAQPKDAKAFQNCHVGISERCCNLTR